MSVRTRRRPRLRRASVLPAAGGVAAVALLAGGCADAGGDKDPEHRSFALHGRTLTTDSDDSDDSALVLAPADVDKVRVTRWFAGHTVIGPGRAARSSDGSVDVSVPRDERSPHVVPARSRDGKVTVRNAN